LAILTDEYLEDFEDMGWSAENFLTAVRMARKRYEGIPAVHELIACHEEICRNPPKKPVAGLIEEEAWVDTPEANAARIFAKKVVAVMLDKGISDTEAREIVLAEEKQRPQLRVVGQ
jgi:hypothetical protein